MRTGPVRSPPAPKPNSTAPTSNASTGHQNSFAHRTVPHLLLACLRTDQPVNLVSAFEQPVLGRTSGIAQQSMVRLAQESDQMSQTWGLGAGLTLATYASLGEGTDKVAEAFGASLPFPELLDRVQGSVGNWLRHGSTR